MIKPSSIGKPTGGIKSSEGGGGGVVCPLHTKLINTNKIWGIIFVLFSIIIISRCKSIKKTLSKKIFQQLINNTLSLKSNFHRQKQGNTPKNRNKTPFIYEIIF